jgi:hypothetical protein
VTQPPSYPPAAPPPWPQPHGAGPGWPAPHWGPPPGPWGAPPPPPRRRWTRKTIALVAGGAVLAAGLVALVVVAGLSIGHDQASALSAAGGGFGAAPTTAPPSDFAGLGNDADLDGLAEECHDGYLMSCDDLFDLSPSGSAYEQYGMTCGGRVKAFDVAGCTELEQEPTSPPSAPPVGDDPGLDGYAQRCHDGLLSACDDLYNLSPPMSDYERYGMSCGGRVDVLTVATCEELDGD